MVYTKGDKFYSSEKGNVKLKLAFEEGKNILSSNFKESISDMVNKVIIVDENGNKKSEVKNDDWLNTYGLFQEVYKQEENKDANLEAKAMLNGITQSCSLTGFGDTTCITGYGVQVKDTHTGLVGLFYIDSDSHSWQGGNYTIDLELNFKNIMNEVSVGEDEKEETTSSSSNDTATTVTGGKEVDAEYTAYYPANNSMQGGLYDAQGNKLDPSKLTCAAPKDIAFGTKIQVKGTGTNRDGLVYKVTDRGGAIKVENGVYKIDLLMATKEECLNFGRRKGKAIIGVETTTTITGGTSSASGTGAKLVELAKSKLGCKYVWGATGPNTFDCSGLMLWCHKQLGITIPRTSLAQSKSGKSVSKSDLQVGDLIFWKTTSAEVGHVGMYVGNNQFIHAPNKSKPVKYDSLDNSYYKSRYVRARRYY